MTFAFLAGYTLEVTHVGCRDRRPDQREVIDSSHFAVRLVVLNEYLN